MTFTLSLHGRPIIGMATKPTCKPTIPRCSKPTMKPTTINNVKLKGVSLLQVRCNQRSAPILLEPTAAGTSFAIDEAFTKKVPMRIFFFVGVWALRWAIIPCILYGIYRIFSGKRAEECNEKIVEAEDESVKKTDDSNEKKVRPGSGSENIVYRTLEAFVDSFLYPLPSFALVYCTIEICKMIAPFALGPFADSNQLLNTTIMFGVIWSFYNFINSFVGLIPTAKLGGGELRAYMIAIRNASAFVVFMGGFVGIVQIWKVTTHSLFKALGLIGVVATFASSSLFLNGLNGVYIHLNKTFQLGDTIKGEKFEGEVIGMGLTSITVQTEKEGPVEIFYSGVLNQEIINKSRTPFTTVTAKIYIDFEHSKKLLEVRSDILAMLLSYIPADHYLKKTSCVISDIQESCAELTMVCYLSKEIERKNKLSTTKHDILLKTIEIIEKHGAKLGKSKGKTSKDS